MGHINISEADYTLCTGKLWYVKYKGRALKVLSTTACHCNS